MHSPLIKRTLFHNLIGWRVGVGPLMFSHYWSIQADKSSLRLKRNPVCICKEIYIVLRGEIQFWSAYPGCAGGEIPGVYLEQLTGDTVSGFAVTLARTYKCYLRTHMRCLRHPPPHNHHLPNHPLPWKSASDFSFCVLREIL